MIIKAIVAAVVTLIMCVATALMHTVHCSRFLKITSGVIGVFVAIGTHVYVFFWAPHVYECELVTPSIFGPWVVSQLLVMTIKLPLLLHERKSQVA